MLRIPEMKFKRHPVKFYPEIDNDDNLSKSESPVLNLERSGKIRGGEFRPDRSGTAKGKSSIVEKRMSGERPRVRA